MKKPIHVLIAASLGVVGMLNTRSAQPEPVNLRCEYGNNPLGVDERQPLLSRELEAEPGERGVQQTAYRVLATSSASKLASGEADLWDSGPKRGSLTRI